MPFYLDSIGLRVPWTAQQSVEQESARPEGSTSRALWGLGRGLAPVLTCSLLSRFPLHGAHSLKAKTTRLRNAAGTDLWQHFQRPLQELQLWRALAQRLLDVTASLPDLPSIHTFLPQIEVSMVLSGGLMGAAGGGHQPNIAFQPVPRRDRRVSGSSRCLGGAHCTLSGEF